MEWLPLRDLRINPAYQRSVGRPGAKNIVKIAATFSWSKFSPVIVRPVPGQSVYEIIDGQHRSTAALMCGLDRVPCYIISVSDTEAAQVFAAVNGTVTPMTQLAILKAAIAGGEPWAVDIAEACREAGVTPLLYPQAKKDQKPLQTMAVAALRRVCAQHGKDVLTAALRLVAASKSARSPGFLTNKIIVAYANIMGSRKGWLSAIDDLERAIAPMDLQLAMPEDVEHRLVKALGDGRKSADAWQEIRAKVLDMRARRMSSQMIAASLRLTYGDVERAIKEGQET
jgi:hypothetical protein